MSRSSIYKEVTAMKFMCIAAFLLICSTTVTAEASLSTDVQVNPSNVVSSMVAKSQSSTAQLKETPSMHLSVSVPGTTGMSTAAMSNGDKDISATAIQSAPATVTQSAPVQKTQLASNTIDVDDNKSSTILNVSPSKSSMMPSSSSIPGVWGAWNETSCKTACCKDDDNAWKDKQYNKTRICLRGQCLTEASFETLDCNECKDCENCGVMFQLSCVVTLVLLFVSFTFNM